MPHSRFLLLLLVVISTASISWAQSPSMSNSNLLFWSEAENPNGPTTVYRADIDGQSPQAILEFTSRIYALSAVKKLQKLYFVQEFPFGDIFRTDLDGSNIEDIGIISPVGGNIDMDEEREKVYFGSLISSSALLRSNLDGSGEESMFEKSEIPEPFSSDNIFSGLIDLFVDESSNRVYCFYLSSDDSGTSFRYIVLRYDVEMDDVEVLFELPSNPVRPFMVDAQKEKIYVGFDVDANSNGSLHQMNFDGSELINLGYGVNSFSDGEIDTDDGFLYFVTDSVVSRQGSTIVRTNLDGSNPVTLVSSDITIGFVTLIPRPNLTNAMPTVFNQFDQFKTVHELYDDVDIAGDGLPDIASFTLMNEALKQYDTEEAQALLEGYEVNLDIINSEADVETLGNFRELIAAWMLMGEETQVALKDFLVSKGVVLTGDYVTVIFTSTSRGIDEPFSGLGDFDMDGFNNALEYANVLARGGTLDDFIAAAIDPASSGSLDGGGGGGGCLIAYAFMDTPLASELTTIRSFRDEYMLSNAPGIMASDMYYRASAFILSERSTRANAGALALAFMTVIASIVFMAGAVKITRRNHVPMD